MADMSAQTNEEEQPASPATSQGGRAITRARFAFVFGFLLAILLYLLMWFSAGGVFVDGVRATAQAAAVFLAGGAVDEEHDTLVVSEETDEEGRSVIGLRVGGARVTVQSSVSSDALTNADPAQNSAEVSGETVDGEAEDGDWWRGPDQPSENDPTPGVTKTFEVPIQGAGGGGGGGGSSSGGEEGGEEGGGGEGEGGGGDTPPSDGGDDGGDGSGDDGGDSGEDGGEPPEDSPPDPPGGGRPPPGGDEI